MSVALCSKCAQVTNSGAPTIEAATTGSASRHAETAGGLPIATRGTLRTSAAQPWNPDVSQQLRTLAPRHRAAIRLKLDGASGSEIAEILGVERRSVYLWFSDPLVKDELARQLECVNKVFAREVALAAVAGLAQLREAVQLPIEGPITPEQKLAFIRETLDRFERSTQPPRETAEWLRAPSEHR